MTFTVKDVENLINVLTEHPELRQRFVRTVLNGSLLEMPTAMSQLSKELRLLSESVARLQRQMDERFRQVDERFDRLEQHTDERFRQVDERFNRLEQHTDERFRQVDERFNQIDERFRQVDERFNQVDERFRQVDERFDQMDKRFDQMDEQMKQMRGDIQTLKDRTGAMRGDFLEFRYRNNIGSFFGQLVRRAKIIPMDFFERELKGKLSEDEIDELFNIDFIVRGQVKHDPNRPNIWFAVEVSATVNTEDITRARQRADLLCQAGYPAIALACGEECSHDAAKEAQQTHVVIMQNGGSVTGWEEALATLQHMF